MRATLRFSLEASVFAHSGLKEPFKFYVYFLMLNNNIYFFHFVIYVLYFSAKLALGGPLYKLLGHQ